uniref:G2/mitotic-specific cyclin-B2 n=1 Tax=Kryptolebias marmoratus TaxID=37003 RepID=A0A3Q3FYZ3_KRYMA
PGKNSSAAPRRAALGELTNFPDATVKTKKLAESQMPSKTSCSQKVKLAKEAAVVQVPAAAEPLQSLAEADVSMKEDELCQAFSEVLFTGHDVDEQDGEQRQHCSLYVKEIYSYLHVLEVGFCPDYMQGYEITASMRALLVDWLVQVHAKFQLLQETLYLTVAILDRFLQVQPVSRRKLQLAGITAMLLACKYEEIYAPEVGDFAYITDNAYTKSQILVMEQLILRSLNFQLGRPLPLHFLRQASKVANKHTLAKYLMELTLLDYDMVHYRPSEIAAASLCFSQLLFGWQPWVSELPVELYTDRLSLLNLSQAVKNKYSTNKLLKISLIPELKSNTVRNMAAPLVNC